MGIGMEPAKQSIHSHLQEKQNAVEIDALK